MSKVLGKNLIVFAAAFALVAMFAFVGCGSQQDSATNAGSANSSAASEEATVQVDVTAGVKSDTTSSIVMKNSTGVAISEIAVVEAGAEGEPEFMAVDGSEWADGKTVEVFFEAAGTTAVDVSLKSGDTVYTLHGFNVEGAENIEVLVEGDIAYVTFEKDGNVVSSLADETAWAEEAAAAAEAAAAEAAAAEEVYYEQPTYTESAPTYNAPAQTQDSCVEGGVVLR